MSGVFAPSYITEPVAEQIACGLRELNIVSFDEFKEWASNILQHGHDDRL